MAKHFYQYPSIVVTSTEVATSANGGSLPGLVKVVAGWDGANVRTLLTDVSGRLIFSSGGGEQVKEFVAVDLFATPAPSATYLEIISSSTDSATSVQNKNTSGAPIEIATGAALSEVGYCVVASGESLKLPCSFPAGTRFAAKSIVSSDADDGFLIVHLLGA